jgi:NAD(P)-dependent dehydrogenase (short-subunit alcohol dehydrogenase family)
MMLKDKIALVTGGGRGIGKGIARRMVQEGAKVIICQRDQVSGEKAVEELSKNGGEIHFVKADISQPNDVAFLFESVLSLYDGLDILVNNAGITGADGSILEMPLEVWQRMIDINLTSVFLCSKEAANIMVTRKRGGRIINIASINSYQALPGACNYVAAKGAIPALTKALAIDLSKYNILVNAIAPGTISTERTGPRLENPDYREMIRRSVPLQRTATVDEIASIAVFLASNECTYVQGETIVADGGILSCLRLD